ncbi:MAG: hypothetical protein PHF00_13750, partial [Elusimicrobia bacterium]|nr:hypothetical protein [Elusimicrobiota bacterium]
MKRALLAILLIELAVFGLFRGQLGFYHDDWVLLEFLTEGGSFWGGMARLAKAGFAVRPLNLPQFSLFHAVGGLNPLPYHLAMLLLEITQGLLLYSLL